jgi:phage portal protein BeeE
MRQVAKQGPSLRPVSSLRVAIKANQHPEHLTISALDNSVNMPATVVLNVHIDRRMLE